MNIIKVQQTFKRLPDEKVAEYVKDPALGFIALMELNERKKERDRYQTQSQQPDIPLSERIPQELGIMSGQPQMQPQMQPTQQPTQQPMQQPMQQPVGMYGGGIVAFNGGGEPEEEQRKKDRAAMMGGLESLGAAAMDVLSLPVRGVAGAAETAITRPLRALGVNVPFLPESFYGGDRTSMTPYYDKLRRERGEGQAPPVVDEANVTGGPGTQIVPQRPPVRTTTQAGPSQARPTQTGPTQATTGIAAYTPQTMKQMIEQGRLGAEELNKLFPDKVSPLMREYQEYLKGKKTSDEEARREGFREFGLKALQGTSRDFLQNIGAAGEAGLGAYKAIQQKNAQIDDTIMQQKIALAQAEEARNRGNFDLAARLNDKAEGLKVQGITLAMEKTKLEDQIKTNQVQRDYYATKTRLAPLQAQAALAKSKNAGNVKPADYARVLKDFEASPQYRNLLKAAQDTIIRKKGKDAVNTEAGQRAIADMMEPFVKNEVFRRMGLDPNTARVGYAYSSSNTDED